MDTTGRIGAELCRLTAAEVSAPLRRSHSSTGRPLRCPRHRAAMPRAVLLPVSAFSYCGGRSDARMDARERSGSKFVSILPLLGVA
eukprot:472807-Prymnesium_polylepis.1